MSTVDNIPGDWAYLYNPAPTLSSDGSTWQATVGFVTDQSNLIPFLTVASGTVESIPYSGGTMSRIVTLQHPLYPWMYAKRIQCQMFGEASRTSTALEDLHSKVQIDVEFESLPFPTSGDNPYMQMSTKGASTYVAVGNRKLLFSNGEELGQNAGYFVSHTAYVVTLYQCPTLNDEVIEPMTGSVNDAEFLGKPAGQMLFESWSSDFEVSTGGIIQYTKQLCFKYQSHPWNQFYRSDGILDDVTNEDGDPLYSEGDFGQLLNS